MHKKSLDSEIVFPVFRLLMAAFLGFCFFLLFLVVMFAFAWLGDHGIGTDMVGGLTRWFDDLTDGSILMIGLFFGALGGMVIQSQSDEE
jgi:hypothetical protein